jgi:hypothetical protein
MARTPSASALSLGVHGHNLDFDRAHSDIEALAADYGISDIYSDENLGMLDSKLVIIDWGMLDPRKLQRSLRRDAKR